MKRVTAKNYTLESVKNTLQQSGYWLDHRVTNAFIRLVYKGIK